MLPKNAYNPSLCYHAGRLYLTCRAHDRNDWRTNLYLAEIGTDWKPTFVHPLEAPKSLEGNSHEDARLFSHNGELRMAWTVSKHNVTQFRAAMAFGRLKFQDGKWIISDHHFPTHGRNDFSAIEKNWCPFVINNQVWCYYATHEKESTFIRLDGSKVAEVVKGAALPWNYGPIHGGAVLPLPDGQLLFFFNSRTGSLAINTHRYHIGCALLDPHPPFGMRHISRRPILYGQEGYNLDGHKWHKANVVFCCGAVPGADGKIHLSYGWNDAKCRVANLTMEELNL